VSLEANTRARFKPWGCRFADHDVSDFVALGFETKVFSELQQFFAREIRETRSSRGFNQSEKVVPYRLWFGEARLGEY
jgi:hypothetical protein